MVFVELCIMYHITTNSSVIFLSNQYAFCMSFTLYIIVPSWLASNQNCNGVFLHFAESTIFSYMHSVVRCLNLGILVWTKSSKVHTGAVVLVLYSFITINTFSFHLSSLKSWTCSCLWANINACVCVHCRFHPTHHHANLYFALDTRTLFNINASCLCRLYFID